MVLECLTPEDEARHKRAVEKIRRRLFRKYQPVDYLLVADSERVLAAYAERCWNAACGEYRVLRWGGLSYSVDCSDQAGLARFAVSHIEADRFNFWLAAAQGYTVSALTVSFSELDEVAYRYVCSFRRANIKPMYVGQRRR